MTPHAYLPPALERGRTWGFALNLYALRSQRNWGVGDFTDLREAVRILRGFDAGVIGINPLHALHYLAPDAASPYSPTSRYFLNPLYIDVEAVEEFEAAGERLTREADDERIALTESGERPRARAHETNLDDFGRVGADPQRRSCVRERRAAGSENE